MFFPIWFKHQSTTVQQTEFLFCHPMLFWAYFLEFLTCDCLIFRIRSIEFDGCVFFARWAYSRCFWNRLVICQFPTSSTNKKSDQRGSWLMANVFKHSIIFDVAHEKNRWFDVNRLLLSSPRIQDNVFIDLPHFWVRWSLTPSLKVLMIYEKLTLVFFWL